MILVKSQFYLGLGEKKSTLKEVGDNGTRRHKEISGLNWDGGCTGYVQSISLLEPQSIELVSQTLVPKICVGFEAELSLYLNAIFRDIRVHNYCRSAPCASETCEPRISLWFTNIGQRVKPNFAIK